MGLQKLTPATEEEILTSPEFAPFREMLWRKRALIEAMPLAGVPKDAVYLDADKTEIAPTSPTGGLGGGTGMDGEYGYGDGGGDDDELPAGGLGLATGLGEKNAYNAYQAAQKRVDAQIKANIDLLTGAQNRLRERRMGPTNAEKWFSIAAALGKPTRTGAFGESLGNLNEALAAQQTLKRKAQEERDALLEQYGLKIGSENLRMLMAGANQAGQVYRAEQKANAPVRGVAVGNRLLNPYTNQEIEPPIGTKKRFKGRTYEFQGGDQYDQNNWKEVG
jgi:hypothetical protein